MLDLPEKNAQNHGEAVAAVKRWLENNSNWLLILDNADEIEIVDEFIPSCEAGHVLLTTRAHAIGAVGGRAVLVPLANRFSKLRKIWADNIYNGGIAERVRNLRRRNRIELEVAKRPEGMKGFLVLARRWVVERTFAWLSFHRRLSKDYEYLPETSEAFIRITMIRLMFSRLT